MKTLKQKKGSSNRILSFLIILLIFNFINLKSSNSQVMREWVQRYGRPGYVNDYANNVGVDRTGSIYCTIANNPVGGNNFDIDLLKYNPDGTRLWVRPFNGIQNENDYVEMFHIDDSSNVYFGGSRNQSSGGQATDPYLIKHNSSGTLQWDISFNSIYEYGNFTDMFTDASGNITALGYWGGSTPNVDGVLKKLTPDGTQIWTNTWVIPGQREDANCLAKDASGNIYIAGAYNLPVQTDIFLNKHSSDGTLLWSVLFNGPQNKADYILRGEMALDSEGNIYLLGRVNIDNIWAAWGNSDIVLLKYNNSGVLQWSRYISGSANSTDHPRGIIIDQQNNIYILGNYKNTGSLYDSFLAKYNTNGDTVWFKRFNNPMGRDDWFYGFVMDRVGNIYVAGEDRGFAGNGNDALLFKYNPAGALIWSQFYNNPSNQGDNDYFATLAIDSGGTVYCIGGSDYPDSTVRDMILAKYSQPPYEPINLTASTVSNRINLSWQDIATNEIGFRIERSSNAGANWMVKDSVMSNVTAYTDSGLAANSIYHYRISSYNSIGASPYSNIAFDTTSFIQVSTLDLSILIEGFYDRVSGTMAQDTLRVYLHNNTSPFNIVDSSIAYLSSEGEATFTFTNAADGVDYYISTKHRNALETWSKFPGQSFSSSHLSYDFTNDVSQAFENNMKAVDESPHKFAVYSGDVTQNGTIDLEDILQVYHDGVNFVSGYVVTDVNGDTTTDISDLLITYNNSVAFVERKIPIN